MSSLKATAIITAFAILGGLQVLAIVAHIYSFIPIHTQGLILPGLEPERESFLYAIFLCVAFFMAAILTIFLYTRLSKRVSTGQYIRFLTLEIMWVTLMYFAFFKWVTYRYPFYNILPFENGGWVALFFYGVTACALMTKIFWPEVDRMLLHIFKFWQNFKLKPIYHVPIICGMTAGIFLLLYPNVTLTLALIEQWSNLTTWQNFGITKFLLSRGFAPEHILLTLFYINMLLIMAIFMAAKRMLHSFWLAAAVTLLVVRMTFFHYGMAPVCWNYPAHTLVNMWGDINFYKDPTHLPMFASLRVRQFFAFFMGYGMVIFYVFSLLNTWGKNKVATALSILGLWLYTRYIGHADVFAYGAVCWPAVLLAGWWFKTIVEHYVKDHARFIYAGTAIISLGALLTSRVFVTYPHFWITYAR